MNLLGDSFVFSLEWRTQVKKKSFFMPVDKE